MTLGLAHPLDCNAALGAVNPRGLPLRDPMTNAETVHRTKMAVATPTIAKKSFSFTELGLLVYKAFILRTDIRPSRSLISTIRYSAGGGSGFPANLTPYIAAQDDVCVNYLFQSRDTTQLRIPHGAYGYVAANSGELMADEKAVGVPNPLFRVGGMQQQEHFIVLPVRMATDNDSFAEPVLGVATASCMLEAPFMGREAVTNDVMFTCFGICYKLQIQIR